MALTPLTKEEQEKVKAKTQSFKIDPVSQEMFFLAKFAKFNGWQGVRDYELGVIPHENAVELLRAQEMVFYQYEYEKALMAFYASKDGKSFTKGTREFTKRVKVE